MRTFKEFRTYALSHMRLDLQLYYTGHKYRLVCIYIYIQIYAAVPTIMATTLGWSQ